MPPEKPEMDSFLAIIEAKIAALKALADSYRAALSLGALGPTGEIDMSAMSAPGSKGGSPIELPQGALLGLSLPAAIKLYLSAARRKQTTREIATGLKEGGVESTAKLFENTLTTALHRLRVAGDVLKFNDGWALAEFYPETLRNRLAAQSEGGKKKAGAAKARKRGRPKKQPAKVLALPPTDEQKEAAG